MENDFETMQRLRRFCQRHDISTSRVLVLTAHENRGSTFCSIIADFQRDRLLGVYPAEILVSTSKEERVLNRGQVLICYADNLPPAPENEAADDADELRTLTERGSEPFCCSAVQPYRARRLDREALFQSLLRHRGNNPEVVYEVKRQINNGPMLSTTYYQVLDNEIREVQGNYSQKLHAFKNYRCGRHNLFFAIDLYQASNTGAYNYHHMRLNPFEHRNPEFLNRVLAA